MIRAAPKCPCRKYSKYTVGTREVRFPVHLWYIYFQPDAGTQFVRSWPDKYTCGTDTVLWNIGWYTIGTLCWYDVGKQPVRVDGTRSVRCRDSWCIVGPRSVHTQDGWCLVGTQSARGRYGVGTKLGRLAGT